MTILMKRRDKNKQWYASVMLNRLIVLPSFRRKSSRWGRGLSASQIKSGLTDQEGEDRFFNKFYRALSAFSMMDLTLHRHNHEFERFMDASLIWMAECLMCTKIEREYANLDIADGAFISLFDFFDKWHWHLDDRMTCLWTWYQSWCLGIYFWTIYQRSRSNGSLLHKGRILLNISGVTLLFHT